MDTIIVDRDIDVMYHLAWAGSAGPLRGNCDVQLKNVRYTCDAAKTFAAIGERVLPTEPTISAACLPIR